MTPREAMDVGIFRGFTRCTFCCSRQFDDEPLFVVCGPDYGWFCSWKCLVDFSTNKMLGGFRPLVAIRTDDGSSRP